MWCSIQDYSLESSPLWFFFPFPLFMGKGIICQSRGATSCSPTHTFLWHHSHPRKEKDRLSQGVTGHALIHISPSMSTTPWHDTHKDHPNMEPQSREKNSGQTVPKNPCEDLKNNSTDSSVSRFLRHRVCAYACVMLCMYSMYYLSGIVPGLQNLRWWSHNLHPWVAYILFWLLKIQAHGL